MSEQHLEIVRSMIERWNANDEVALAQAIDPGIELHTPFSSVAGEPYRGIEGYRRWRADIREHFDEWRLDVERLEALDGGRVLASGSVHVRGHESGVEIDQPSSAVIELREGRVWRVRIFLGEHGGDGEAGTQSRPDTG